MRNRYSALILMALVGTLCSAQSRFLGAWTESDMTLGMRGDSISGSLVMPDGDAVPPVVLIIAGSGPTDRNCNSALGIASNAYQLLAQGLAGKGIATLRYDKRGVGRSASAMTRENDLRFETYADDAGAWISKLKSDRRFSRVIVLGHSEGSLLGMIAARRTHADAFISVSGVGRPADQLLLAQMSQWPPAVLQEARTVVASLKGGKTIAVKDPNLAPVFRPSVQPYLISWMKYDPAVEIAKLAVPVLILQGTTDLQVTVEDATLLSAANPAAKLHVIEKMNHVLKEAEADIQSNVATYKAPALPLKASLVDEIAAFIRQSAKP